MDLSFLTNLHWLWWGLGIIFCTFLFLLFTKKNSPLARDLLTFEVIGEFLGLLLEFLGAILEAIAGGL